MDRTAQSNNADAGMQEFVRDNFMNGQDAFAIPIPDPSTAYEDPFLSVRSILWLHPGINGMVRSALEKMEKAFAYNSVFFLKAVLDLQVQYRSMDPPPAPEVILNLRFALKISQILSSRLARKEKVEGCSLSRELQLRTLVSALFLLSTYSNPYLDNDTYASLLKHVSERDYDNYVKFVNEGRVGPLGSGDCDFLVRFACDLVRCMPNDFGIIQMGGFGSQAVHFMLASGLVNQVRGGATLAYMEELFTRLSAAPSAWHRDIRLLYDGVCQSIHLRYHSLAKGKGTSNNITAGSVPGSVTAMITRQIIAELRAFEPDAGYQVPEGYEAPEDHYGRPFPVREGQLLLHGLLDLLCQMVTLYAACENVCSPAELIALEIITRSNIKEFRFKAFDIIIASRTGSSEEEFFATMRKLERYIISLAGPPSGNDISNRPEKDSIQYRSYQLKKEKRAAMDRYERKMILYRGAIESLHRRLQGKVQNVQSTTSNASQHSLMSQSWEALPIRVAVSPAPPIRPGNGQKLFESPTSLAVPDIEFPNPDNIKPLDSALTDVAANIHTEPGTQPHPLQLQQNAQGFLVADDTSRQERPLSFQRDAPDVLQVLSQPEWTKPPSADPNDEGDEGASSVYSHSYQNNTEAPTGALSDGTQEEDSMSDFSGFRPPKRIGDRKRADSQSSMGSRKPVPVYKKSPMKGEDNGYPNPLFTTNTPSIALSNQGSSDWVIVDEEPTTIHKKSFSAPASNAPSTIASHAGSFQSFTGEMANRSATDVSGIRDSSRTYMYDRKNTQNTDISLESRQPGVAIKPILPSLQTDIDSSMGKRTNGEVEFKPQAKNKSNRVSINTATLPGVNLEYTLPTQTISERDRAMLRNSAQSPIPLNTEPGLAARIDPTAYFHLDDGGNAPEVVDFLQEGQRSEDFTSGGKGTQLQKRPSRAVRLLSSIPGSGVKGELLSRINSIRTAPADRAKQISMIASNAPEIVPSIQPLLLRRSQTGPDIYNEKMELLRRHTNAANHPMTGRETGSAPNISSIDEVEEVMVQRKVEYDAFITERVFKLTPKESFMVLLTMDCQNVIYLSPAGFQVYAVPISSDVCTNKAKFTYRIGEAEGIKKGKCSWEYKTAAASMRYIATLTKSRIQVHDIWAGCRSVFVKEAEGQEYHSIAIAADKMVVGMAPIKGATGAGSITIFLMSDSDALWEEWKIIHLLIPVSGGSDPHGAPNILSLTMDGRCLTASTKAGYYFAWDIETDDQPILIGSGRVLPFDGSGNETITDISLFPDTNHILCSTVSNYTDHARGGSFTEPTRITDQPVPHHLIRQVGVKIYHSALSHDGNAAAFLGRTGQISVVPILHIEGDLNVTSLAAVFARQMVQASIVPESAGRVMFTLDNSQLVAVDRKGKVVILGFKRT